MTSRPACRARRLGFLVQHHKAGLATGPSARDELERLGIGQEVVAHIPHGVEIKAVAPSGHEHPRMCALERVKVGEVEEVSYPAIDAQQVERGGRDEVQGRGVGVKERAYVRKSVQHAAGAARGHDHTSRGDVDAWARRSDPGGRRGATVSATAVSSHTFMPQVCTCLWPCAFCAVRQRLTDEQLLKILPPRSPCPSISFGAIGSDR